MVGSELKLAVYMQGPNKRFVIPVYQRNYDWKIENCKQLFDDLVKVVQSKRKSHFFGSIVSVYNSDGAKEEFLIIDGQQRLATVSILLLAMHNLLEEKVIISADTKLSSLILDYYLINTHVDDEERIKLKPVKDDSTAFQKLFKDSQEHVQGSNLTINYNYFRERILKKEVTPDELFDAICRLEVINIKLNQDDNPQLIFESLNSTGVALSEGDKIRNFILMGLPTKEQNKYYEDYWNKIEICTNYDVSAFVRDYLSIKEQAIPPQYKVYQIFKSYVEEKDFDTEILLKDLLAYANRYEILLKGTTANKELNAIIYRLNRLETTVTRPFFLEVLRMREEEKINNEELVEIFRITENYLFRRTICELPTNSLNKIFLMLHREVIRFDGTDTDYLSKLKYAILSKKDRARFPEDEEFTQTFSNRQVYNMNSKNRIYILERIENYGTLEDKDIYRHFDDGSYSIEHIMPQNLTPAWRQSLGKDVYEQIHESWVDRIANLTLTAYNSKYSNNTFQDKKTMKYGFLDSGIKMNMYIAQKDKWTLKELEDRDQYLMKRALEIWRSPKTDYKPTEKIMDFYTLEDDVDLSGRQIAKFVFKNTEQPVQSWIEMYERMLKILHSEDKAILSQLAYTSGEGAELSAYFSKEKTKLRGYVEIEDGIFAEKNTSTWAKINILRRLFKSYEVDWTDLVFYLKDEDVDEEKEAEAARHKLRREFWEFALPTIKEAHNGESFSNVGPVKENWISGFFGVSGASISCVANYDEARVEFQLYSSDGVRSKKLFDALHLHKEEIESALNSKLEWDRADDKKSSKVFVCLPEVGINKESDWEQVSQFHAEWSKKFYDVIVPYVKNV